MFMNEEYIMFTHSEHSNVFKRWCIVTVIIFIAGGIISGFVFESPGKTMFDEPHFNWLLMLGVWSTAVVPTAILYAVWSHLENQEIMINNLNEIRKSNENMSDTEKSYVHTTNFRELDENNATWYCSKCGMSNKLDNDRCVKCDSKKPIV